MTSVEFDMRELREYATTLGKAGETISRESRDVVKRGAQNIKNAMQRDLGRSRWFDSMQRAVNYDMRGNAFYAEAEVGVDKGGFGDLANIAYFGTSKGGGTVPDPLGALLDEIPRFEKALGDLAEKNLS